MTINAMKVTEFVTARLQELEGEARAVLVDASIYDHARTGQEKRMSQHYDDGSRLDVDWEEVSRWRGDFAREDDE